eukprot:52994-Rhodomonas_salina.2
MHWHTRARRRVPGYPARVPTDSEVPGYRRVAHAPAGPRRSLASLVVQVLVVHCSTKLVKLEKGPARRHGTSGHDAQTWYPGYTLSLGTARG